MTAQIQFFCSPKEEQVIVERLLEDPVTSVFSMDGERFKEMCEVASSDLPRWPEFLCLYLWASKLGPLRWHREQPKLEGATHRSLVARLFAREDWDKFELEGGDNLLDQDLSPGICYKRAEQLDGRTGPCTLIAPPSSLERVGLDYVRWVNRCMAWIRRRGRKVHDCRTPSSVIPNPRGLLKRYTRFPTQ